MPKVNNREDSTRKRAKSGNVVIQRKEVTIADRLNFEKIERLKSWITFYRNNMHRFVQHYLGVHLYPYQRIMIYDMNKSTRYLALCSRAAAKSWLVGVFLIAKCILYPGTKAVIASGTKGQAMLIISEKIQELYGKHPNIQREIRKITTNNNTGLVTFHNGSQIKATTSTDTARGNRSNVLVLEERAIMDSSKIEKILRPFLVSRIPAFLELDEYRGKVEPEEALEIVISSVSLSAMDWYGEAKSHLREMCYGNMDYRAIFLDYLISMEHGIKTKKQMKKERTSSRNPLSFSMEYENIPGKSSENSYFKIDHFVRNLKIPWIPRRRGVDGLGKNKYNVKRKPGERRYASIDIASSPGSQNDKTALTLARLFKTSKGWRTDISYIEIFNVVNAHLQALRIKQVTNEFFGEFGIPGDVIVLDVAGVGKFLYDSMTVSTEDDEFGLEYPALKVMEHPTIPQALYDDLKGRTLDDEAEACIYPISGNTHLNSDIASAFRVRLKSNLLRFLVLENIQEDYWLDSGNKDVINHGDIALKPYILSANANTTQLIYESISLEMTITDGNKVRLKEPTGMRKDRYSSASYLNYVVSLHDHELLKNEKPEDDWETLMGALAIM